MKSFLFPGLQSASMTEKRTTRKHNRQYTSCVIVITNRYKTKIMMTSTMRLKNTLLFLLLSVSSVMVVVIEGQTDQQQGGGGWNGCINPTRNKNENLVLIQQLTRICISIANDTNWNSGTTSYIRASFEPQADIYSRFHIPNSYRDLVQRKNSTTSSASIFSNSKTISISASSQQALSFVRTYYDTENDRVYPFLTAIMDVQRGVVKGITWDNACVFCGGTECIESTYNYNGVRQNQSSAGQTTRSCSISTEDCNSLLSTNSSSAGCDITIYTVWTGTDANGIALQSQAYRFSEFPPQELSDRITQLLVPDAAADFIQTRNDNTNTTTRNRVLPTLAVHQVMEDHFHQSSQQQQQQEIPGVNTNTIIIHEDGDL